MVEGRSREAWSRTSSIVWATAECNRNPKRRRKPFKPADFDPHANGNGRRRRPKRGRSLTVEELTNDLLKMAESNKRGLMPMPPRKRHDGDR